MDVTIVIATYGERSWLELTMQRAAASAFDTGAATIVVHGLTLHGARNAGLAQVQTEHVIFLDADDELEAGYLEAMAAGNADLRAPAVRYMRPTGRAHEPYVPRVCGHTHDCAGDCLPHGNWLVIGTCARTALVRAAGGFRDFSWSEDWDLWLRCWRAGATVEALPAAVYRAHMRADSRNRAPDRAAKLAAHEAIYQANYGEAVSA